MKFSDKVKIAMPKWHDDQGVLIACNEKLKVMEQNITELRQFALDAFEDGILMGINKQQLKDYLVQLLQEELC